MNIAKLLTANEGQWFDRKRALQDLDKLRTLVCAFANDLAGSGQPGHLIVGQGDDQALAQGADVQELVEKLANLRSDGSILPLPTISIREETFDGGVVVVIEVLPSLSPPVRAKGVAWVRVGSQTVKAGPDDERRLAERRRAIDLPFDLQPAPAASLEDLDLEQFERAYLPAAVAPSVLEENQRSRLDQMRALRLLTPGGLPTVTGVLVLGRDPRFHLPGAYLQFLQLDGEELTDPIVDQHEISGPIAEQLRTLDEVLRARITTSATFLGLETETRISNYPFEALQQIVRNAVLHRSYEGTNAPVRVSWFRDRVEILSPGGPYGLVNVGNFGQPGLTSYRNPTLAEALKVLGFVQRFGVGIPTARRALERNGNPPLELTPTPEFVLATVRRRP